LELSTNGKKLAKHCLLLSPDAKATRKIDFGYDIFGTAFALHMKRDTRASLPTRQIISLKGAHFFR
jgi:hypothetical protein